MEDYYSREDYTYIQSKWCCCSIRGSEPWLANQFYVIENTDCVLCNALVEEKHYHCGYCSKLTKIN